MTSSNDYDSIAAAVIETERGRWFLSEYARRNRETDTTAVLDALAALEARMATPVGAPSACGPHILTIHDGLARLLDDLRLFSPSKRLNRALRQHAVVMTALSVAAEANGVTLPVVGRPSAAVAALAAEADPVGVEAPVEAITEASAQLAEPAVDPVADVEPEAPAMLVPDGHVNGHYDGAANGFAIAPEPADEVEVAEFAEAAVFAANGADWPALNGCALNGHGLNGHGPDGSHAEERPAGAAEIDGVLAPVETVGAEVSGTADAPIEHAGMNGAAKPAEPEVDGVNGVNGHPATEPSEGRTVGANASVAGRFSTMSAIVVEGYAIDIFGSDDTFETAGTELKPATAFDAPPPLSALRPRMPLAFMPKLLESLSDDEKAILFV